MMRRLSILALAWIPAILAAGTPNSLFAQTNPIPLTAFDIGASPNPIGDEFYTTLTAFVFGTAAAPNGTVNFYISGSSTICSADTNSIGSVAVNANGVATLNYYAGASGTFAICANYIPGAGDAYTAATAGVYLLAVNQPTTFTVSVPAAVIQGAPVNFTFGLTTPSGQTPPTGTITLEDPNNSYTTIGAANVTNGVISPNPVSAALSGNSYYAVYSGDTNYASQSVSGTVLIENTLSSITPASVTAGSPATNVALNGLGFTGNSLVYLILPTATVSLPVNGLTSTQIQTTIPAAYLLNSGQLSIEVITGNTTGGPVQLQVYAPYTDSIAASSPPTTLPYGSTVSTTINAKVTRGVPATDAAVPAGQVNFTLAGSGYSALLGTAQLSQVSTHGTYLNPFTEPMDNYGTGKLIAADLNGDGFVDVVGLPTFYPGNAAQSPYLQVMLSTGVNAFQTEQQVFTGCLEQDFALGDINNDGIPDLVVVCSSSGYASQNVTNLQAYYLLGNGDGTFQSPVAFGTNSFIGAPTQVVLGQFNGDGYLDIAVIDGVNGEIQVISPFANPNNPLGPEVGFDISNGSVVTAGAADFNQDGLSDVAVEEYSSQYGTAAVFVLLSQGNGNGFYVPSESEFSSDAFYLSSMAITDVNGDGFPDIAVADPGVSFGSDTGNLLVFENDGTGVLNETFDDPINGVDSVAGAPFPAVGQPASNAAAAPVWNLVFTYVGTNNDLWVNELQRQSATSWTSIASFDTAIIPFATDGGTLPDFLVAGDMNGDGYLDFALTGSSTLVPYQLQPWYYSNDAQTSLTSSTQVPLPGNYTLSLSYPGNQLYEPSTTPNGSSIVITKATPAGALVGPGAITYGSSANVNANVNGVNTGVPPAGSVTFFDGATTLQTVGLVPGAGSSSTASFSTTQLAPGSHNITIGYTGDSNYLAANPLASTTLQVSATTISLSLTSSTASTTSGTVVNFQVQATGPVLPTGQTVTLTGLPSAGTVTVPLNSTGLASYNYGLFPPGTYSITASFAGNASFGTAASNSVPLQVTATPVSVSLASSANPVTYPATFNLTSAATTGGLGLPTGTLSFQNNGTSFSTGTLTAANGSSGLASVGTIDTVTGQTVIAVVTGDFNKDGKPDVATLETGSGVASLLISLGNGDGTFQTPVSYTSSTFGIDATSIGMAAADFNGDGYTDLVIVASDGYVLIAPAVGDTAGDLTLSQELQITGTPIAVATGDFNHDGNQDFAVITRNSAKAFYGTGSTPVNFPAAGSWTSSFPGSALTGIAVADFNKDGYADIAISDNSGPDIAILLYNPQAGTFNAAQTYPVGASASAIASGDVNGDSFPDLAVVSRLDSTVDVLVNNANNGLGAGTFAAGNSYGVATQPYGVTTADFNRDGYSDIAVSGISTGQGGGTTILLGSSTGAMVGETSLPATYGKTIASADFNGDGNPDLLVGYSGVKTFLDSAAQISDNNVALTAGTAPLTAVYAGSASGQFAANTSAVLNEVISQATPIISWSSPAPITYGTALGATQLNATSSVPGTFTYTPSAGTVLGAGPQILSVTFVPNDTIDYSGATAQVSINVAQASTTITWPKPAAINYGTALSATQLNASASVPGTLVYTPAAGTTLTAGTQFLRVNLTPNDTVDYSASSATVQIQINQAVPVISWATPAPITYGTKLGASQLNATASAAGTLTYTPAAGTTLGAGTQTLKVTFAPTDTVDYTAASTTVQLQVNQATPVITWANPAAITYGTTLSATQLNATANPAGGAFTYVPPIGDILPVGTQTLRVTYVPTDTVDYATTAAQVSIVVRQAATTVTWATPAAITYGTPLSATQLNATASVPGTFTYTPALGTVLGAGSQTLHVTFTPTDATDYSPSTGSVQLQVNQATPVITWATPATILYGTKLSATQLNATASTAGAFTYTPAAGTTPTAGLQTLTVKFTPTNAVDYTTATGSVQLQVNQATPVITWANPAAIPYGTTLSATQLNATAVPAGGTFAYTPAAGATLSVGTQTLQVTYTPKDTVDYANATAQVSIIVNRARSTVTWATPAAIAYGTALSAAQLNATSSVPGSFAYTPALGTVLSAGMQTLKVTFTPTDATDYSASTSTVQLQVNQATPAITWNIPAAIPYGTKLSATQMNATASVPGTFAYTPAAGTTLTAGSQPLTVKFTPTDAVDYTTATGSTTIQVNQATPVITWANPAAISYGTTLSATQLDATATPSGGAFTYAPPTGTTLPLGTQTLSVKYVPADTVDYASASATVSILVNPGLALTSILPTSANYGAAATTITLTGTGFTAGSIVQLNGTTITSSYFSPTKMTAVIPTTFLQQVQPGAITVTNPAASLTSAPVTFTVTLPNIQLEFTGPGTEPAGQQPTLNLAFLQEYPRPLQVTLTLAVKPATAGGPVDPAVQFSTGGSTFAFTLPANSTTVPAIQLQTGTIASTITVTLTVESDSQDLTPTGLQPVVIDVPASAPVITSVVLARNGTSLTVTIQGYSSTRDMTSADFTFTPASGDSISDPQLTVDLATSFSGWYGESTSTQYGSAFTYKQNFTLSNDASTIGSISVKLTNSAGSSSAGAAN
jgi:hypothetical protein